MKNSASISFIGAGNLAWHLAPALDNTAYAVREVFSRDNKNSSELVSKLYEAEVKDSLDFSESSSGIFILAVSDDVIEDLIEEIQLPEDSILIHTSGSRPISVLTNSFTQNTGVLYPLQTFTKGKKNDISAVPFFVEGKNTETENHIYEMARVLSKNVYTLPSDKRAVLHLAAVFASNFTNHMLSIAEDITRSNKLDYDWLKPLIAETLNKSLDIGPERAQTGPAKRHDLEILDKHFDYLNPDKSLQEIYRIISQHILDKYQT